MGNKAKNLALTVCAVLAILGFLFTFNALSEVQKYRNDFSKEMASRLDLEESLANLREEKMEIIAALKENENQLRKNKTLIEGLNDELTSKEAQLRDIQLELGKLTLLKNKLEDNLKDELIKKPSAKSMY